MDKSPNIQIKKCLLLLNRIKKMKRIIAIIFGMCLLFTNVYLLADEPIDTEVDDSEMLDENGTGPNGWHKKTVGCGSKNFEDWIPYCCRGYNPQCTAYTCNKSVYGCD